MREKDLSVPKWHRIKSRHSVGRRVDGFIVRELSVGVLVYLGGGAMGFLSNEEIKTGEKHLGLKFPDTSTVEAFVTGHDDDRKQLRLALISPEKVLEWLKRVDSHVNQKKITAVVGTVRSHIEGGVFVEFDFGIQGYLPASEIPIFGRVKRKPKPEELLYIDDQVRVGVTNVDYDQKRVRLGIKTLWEREESQSETEGIHGVVGEIAPYVGNLETFDDFSPAKMGGISRTVLLLEDEKDSREAVGLFLEKQGKHTVYTVNDSVSALDLASQKTFDCIVADVHLIRDIDGIEVCRRILQRQPDVKIIFISGFLREEDVARMRALEKSVLSCLVKPTEMEVLAKLVATLAPDEQWWENEELVLGGSGQLEPHHRGRSDSMMTKVFDECYSRAENQLSPFKMAIFKRDSTSNQFSLCYSRGIDQHRYQEVTYDLEYSPIATVIRDGVSLFESELSADDKTFAKLRPLTDFNAFLGYPLKVMDQAEYGLFLFRENPTVFTGDEELKGMRIANRLGIEIERILAHTGSMRELSRANLVEQFFREMIHETKNAVWAQQSAISNLGAFINDLKTGADFSNWSDIDRCMAIIKKEGGELRTGLQRYMRLLSPDAEQEQEKLPLASILREVVESMRFSAEDAGVHLGLFLPDENQISDVSFQVVPLRYALVNLILNAIEHLSEHDRNCPWVRVEVKVDSVGSLPIKIRVLDNGIGIHTQHLNRVFEKHFTTKDKGMGLGLDIAKKWVEFLGGNLRIEASTMYAGTIFLIELPDQNV